VLIGPPATTRCGCRLAPNRSFPPLRPRGTHERASPLLEPVVQDFHDDSDGGANHGRCYQSEHNRNSGPSPLEPEVCRDLTPQPQLHRGSESSTWRRILICVHIHVAPATGHHEISGGLACRTRG
jgi:hypothetical protein